MRISDIDPTSPLYGRVKPGYRVLSINGYPVADSLDFHFRASEPCVDLRFADPDGHEFDLRYDGSMPASYGVTLEDDRIKVCDCDCIFCFVRQQPRGMRSSLYLKDEDYRLSFIHGNYITLSNLSDDDLSRIIEQRLSPLYVSVHVTDDNLRGRMLRNQGLRPILPTLRHLTENGIELHTQAVICPGINDGDYLTGTIEDLSGLYPGVATLAIVPVGLTRYRTGLTSLRVHTAGEARTTVKLVEKFQRRFLRTSGSRFVWPADEFYVIAGLPFPRRESYEETAQFENGVGMAAEFIVSFNRRRRFLKGLEPTRHALLLTGHSAYPFLTDRVLPYITEELGLPVRLHPVTNRFWGANVTVSGLLTGQDLLQEAHELADGVDVVVLPPNCLNTDDRFLDDMTLTEFRERLGLPVHIGSYDLARTLREVFQ